MNCCIFWDNKKTLIMETFFKFLFWTSAYFFLLGLTYQFLVKPQDNPAFSRAFILGGLMLSLISGLGFLLRTSLITVLPSPGALTLPEVIVYAFDGLEKSSGELLLRLFSVKGLVILTLVVSALIALRFMGSLFYLLGMGKIQKRIRIDGLWVIPIRGERSPFSFFRMVFIPERLIGEPSLEQVLLHEQAHIQKLHSLDLIFTEFLTIIFWFHPAIWYLRRELKLQHEYEADRYVLRFSDRLEYQQLLLNFSFNNDSLPITNPFNFSPLKKRIKMMNKTSMESRNKAALSLFASLVMFAGMFLLQSMDLQANQLSLNTSALLEVSVQSLDFLSAPPPGRAAETQVPPREAKPDNEEFFVVVENAPKFPGGMEALGQFMSQNVKYPPEARRAGVQGTVFVSFIVEKDGKVSTVKVIRGVSEALDMEAVRVVSAMPDWEPGTQRGENVRVQFNLPVRFALDVDKESGSASVEESINVRISDQPVFFIDGVKVDTGNKSLDEVITPDEIESITVYKDGKGRELFGYDNVIAITRKKTREE